MKYKIWNRWNVFLYGKWIDSVTYQVGLEHADVLRALIEHDGYSPMIQVVLDKNH